MDPLRPLGAVTNDRDGVPLRRAGEVSTDLDSDGGAGGGDGPAQRRRPPGESSSGGYPAIGGLAEPDIDGPINEEIGRLLATGNLRPEEPEALRHLRGVRHYREDPTTSWFRRPERPVVTPSIAAEVALPPMQPDQRIRTPIPDDVEVSESSPSTWTGTDGALEPRE